MSVFESLNESVVDSKNYRVEYKQLEAPWKSKDYADNEDLKVLKAQIDELSALDHETDEEPLQSDDTWGKDNKKGALVKVDKNHALAVSQIYKRFIYLRITLLSFLSLLFKILFFLFIIGFVIGMVEIEVWYDGFVLRAEQLLPDIIISFASNYPVITVLSCLVLAFLFMSGLDELALCFRFFKNKLYKKTIVHQSLDNFFDVKYVDSDDDSDPKYETLNAYKKNDAIIYEDNAKCIYANNTMGIYELVKLLGIRSGQWNKLTYNDMFMVEFNGKPMVFVDLVLMNHLMIGRSEVNYEQFMGQLLIMPIKTPCGNCASSLADGEDQEQEPSSVNRPVMEWTRYSWLRRGNETVNGILRDLFKGCTIPENHEAPLSLDEWGGKYYNVFKSLRSISKCDYGVVVTKGFIVLILENNFDPFEFSFVDNFKPLRIKLKQITRQSAWVCRVVKALYEGGVV